MEDPNKRGRAAAPTAVRQDDIEPYTALRWVSWLFKFAAIFLLVAIIGQFVAGLRMGGVGALPIVLGELARTIVLGIVLWGGGDLVRLLVHLGHDIRAQRVLLGRIANRLPTNGDTGEEVTADAAVAEEADGLRAGLPPAV